MRLMATKQMRIRPTSTLALAAAALLCSGLGLRADDPPRIDEQWLDLYRTTAAAMTVTVDGLAAPLALQTDPILTYSNPVRVYQQHGALFLWTDRGRPLFVGCIWSGADLSTDGAFRYLSHEGHSLSSAPIRAEQDSDTLWQSESTGVDWTTIPDSTPARNRALRLTQMRGFARTLNVTMDAEAADLRLLTQPVYRYPDDAPEVLDGALFTWVMGTDPELFLVVEASEAGWRMACARFTNEAMTVTSTDGMQYECARIQERTVRGPYWLNWDVQRLPADLSDL
jgi:hypothetical protein